MKYKVKKDGDFEKTIEIDIDFEDLESKKDEAISKISKSLKVKGFRPGKIPKNIVIREVGEDYVLEESIDIYLPEQIFEILQKEEINPAVRPVVKDLKKEKKSYKVDVLITLWPKLSKLPKLNQTVEVDSITPTEEEIADQIDRIKLQFADVTKVERPSKTSDYLLVNISGIENGKELEDFSYQDYLYELGSNSLTPSMDKKLEGVSTGAIIKFNDDIPSIEKSNIEITVLVKEIKEKVMPELTDDWVSSMTEFDSVTEMNDELYKNIEMVKKRQIANQYQGLLTSKLIEESKLELPEQLVIAEMDSILQNFMAELNQNNIKIEDYLQITGLTEESLQEDLKNQATRNLSMVVILDKVVEDQEIKLEEKEISYIDDYMSSDNQESNEVEAASRRLNLEAESLRNKAMLHILQQGVSVDKDGEKVYLQDVYNQDEEVREEE
jgi:trigger factor